MACGITPQMGFAEEQDSVLTFVRRVARIDGVVLSFAGWPAFENRPPADAEERVLQISSAKGTVSVRYTRAGWYSDTGRYAIESRIIDAFRKL